VLSPTTRRRDQNQKKDFYTDARIPEYWTVDPEQGAITVVRPGQPPMIVRETLLWQPHGTVVPLAIPLARVFGP